MAVRFNALPLTYILVALVFFLFSSAAVESAAPAPAADCSSLVLNLADCLSYVTVGGTAEKPEGTCCSGLKTVLKTDAECLCEGFRNSAQLGVTLNMTKALALPSACHVSAPSVSNCGLNIVPAMAPGLSPTAAESPTSVPGAPSASGVEVPPGSAPAAAGNSATSVMATSAVLLVLIAVAGVSFSLF